MKIEVTQEDIVSSTRCKESIYYCPIALAVKRKMNINFNCGVKVYEDEISIISIGQPYSYYKLPKKAKEFIKCFDKGLKVKPFTFEARKTE